MKILAYKEKNLLIAIVEAVAKLNNISTDYNAQLIMGKHSLQVCIFVSATTPDGYASLEIVDDAKAYWNDTVSSVTTKDGKMQTEVNLEKILKIIKKYIDKH